MQLELHFQDSPLCSSMALSTGKFTMDWAPPASGPPELPLTWGEKTRAEELYGLDHEWRQLLADLGQGL